MYIYVYYVYIKARIKRDMSISIKKYISSFMYIWVVLCMHHDWVVVIYENKCFPSVATEVCDSGTC